MIGNVSKAFVTQDSSLIIWDGYNGCVFHFGLDGRFLNKIGKKGEGPNEYSFANDVVYDNQINEKVVYNNNRKELMCYKPNGTLKEIVKVGFFFTSFTVINKDYFALYLNNRMNKNEKSEFAYNFKIINRKGKINYETFPYQSETLKFSTYAHNVFSYGNKGYLFKKPYDRVVYHVGQDLLTPYFTLNFGENNIPLDIYSESSKNKFKDDVRHNNRYIYAERVDKSSNFIIANLVKEGKYSLCLYYPTKEIVLSSSFIVNDIWGGVSKANYIGLWDNKTISVVDAQSFSPIQDIIELTNNNAKSIKRLYKESLNSFHDKEILKQFDNYLDKNFKGFSNEEKDFILRIKEDDNPILQIARIKMVE